MALPGDSPNGKPAVALDEAALEQRRESGNAALTALSASETVRRLAAAHEAQANIYKIIEDIKGLINNNVLPDMDKFVTWSPLEGGKTERAPRGGCRHSPPGI